MKIRLTDNGADYNLPLFTGTLGEQVSEDNIPGGWSVAHNNKEIVVTHNLGLPQGAYQIFLTSCQAGVKKAELESMDSNSFTLDVKYVKNHELPDIYISFLLIKNVQNAP